MAKRRMKSYEDISAQVRRIQSQIDKNSRRFTGGYGTPRYAGLSNLVVDIADRYAMNMMKNDRMKGREGDAKRKYSRNVYMGAKASVQG